MGIDRSRRVTFEEVADLYHETSLDYPTALVDDVVSLSDIPAKGRILEIGCGPGNATVPFARRGYPILAIELGERLAALAAHNCRAYPGVSILNSAFEDWEVAANTFDLAIAADAFHWIAPEVGYVKVAEALKASGSAAFFWTVPVDPQTDWSRAIDEVYEQRSPLMVNPHKAFDASWLVEVIKGNFAASRCFGDVAVKHYAWTESYTAEHYVKRLRTFSDHRGVDQGTRQRLYAGIMEVIAQFGGQIEQPLVVALFHARVKK